MLSNTRIKLAAFAAAGLSTTLIALGAAGVIPARADAPESILHTFFGAPDGATPEDKLTLGPDGAYYGTTEYGGQYDKGTVFKITAAGTLRILHSFGAGYDGRYPESPVTFGPGGNIYGTTVAGQAPGANANGGTLYQLNPTTGAETILHYFGNGADGSDPIAGVMYNAKVNTLYGMTFGDGSVGTAQFGTIFNYAFNGQSTNDAYHVLYRFGTDNGPTDGEGSSAPLIESPYVDSQGFPVLYGVTSFGGAGNYGTMFVFDPSYSSGTLTVLHAFDDGSVLHDGRYPFRGALQFDGQNNVYGTTSQGGVSIFGTVFKVAPDFTETILHDFGNGANGAFPQGGVLLATDGNFYGTTSSTTSTPGNVFSLTTAGTNYTVLDHFAGALDGQNPLARLLEDGNGNLLGITDAGGAGGNGMGTIFELATALPNNVGSTNLQLIPQEITGNSSRAIGVVTLNQPAPSGGATFDVVSYDPDVAFVQPTMTIPFGQIRGTFGIQTFPVTTARNATVGVYYHGQASETSISVIPQPAIPSLADVSLDNDTVIIGNQDLGYAYLNGNAAADTTIKLTSSNPAVAQVDKTVVVHKGATRYFFHLTTANVTATQSVTITASLSGVSKSTTLTILPTPPALKNVSLSSASVKGGTAATDTSVRLTVPALADTLVFLTSSDTSAAAVPSSVLIPRGSATAHFSVMANSVTTARQVRITAKSGGVTHSATLTVTP